MTTATKANGVEVNRSRACRPMEVRFCEGVDFNGPLPVAHPELGPCWVWPGRRHSNGYVSVRVGGRYENGGRNVLLHRWAYEAVIGPIPAGLELDHFACDNRWCVNPNHVRPTTHRENLLRGNTVSSKNLAKTACAKGHEYTEENTYVDPTGSRHCRTCGRDVMRNQWRKNHGKT